MGSWERSAIVIVHYSMVFPNHQKFGTGTLLCLRAPLVALCNGLYRGDRGGLGHFTQLSSYRLIKQFVRIYTHVFRWHDELPKSQRLFEVMSMG